MSNIHAASMLLAGVLLLGGNTADADIFFESTDTGRVASEDGRFYGSVSAGAYFLNAPRRRDFGAIYEEDDNVQLNRIHEFEPSDAAPFIGLTLGHVFRSAGDSWYGTGLRGELSGHYFTAGDDKTVIRNNSASGYYTDILALDGTGYVTDLGSGDTIQAKFDADYDYWDIGYRILSDIRLQDERFTITPSIGISYARFDEEYDIRYRNLSDNYNFNFIDEEVNTWFIGPTLGAQLHFQATPRVSLQIGGTAWLTYADSDYSARQIYFPDDDNDGSRASDSRNRFAFRGTLSGSASYDSGWALLSLAGGLDYWDYAPVIQHPVAPLGESYSDVGPTAPARLASDSMLNYFIGLKLSVPFDI